MPDQQANYTYELSNKSKKYECPECGDKSFKPYVYKDSGEIVDEEKFGRCDHDNSCAAHIPPWADENFKPKKDRKPKKELPPPAVVRPQQVYYKPIFEDLRSAFHDFCRRMLNMPDRHLIKWRVGSYYSKTAFGCANREGALLNIKFIQYTSEGKRDKSKKEDGKPKSVPHYMGARYLEKYGYLQKQEQKDCWQDYFLIERCFYGLHLWDPNKPTCIVESEKTAVIAAFFFPKYNWLSTGGNSGLKFEHFAVFHGYELPIYNLVDNDKAGIEKSKTIKWLDQIANIRQDPRQIRSVNLFPNAQEGYDTADAIIYDSLRDEETFASYLDSAEVVGEGSGLESAQSQLFISSGLEINREMKDRCERLFIIPGVTEQFEMLDGEEFIGVPRLDDLYKGLSRQELKGEIYKLIAERKPIRLILVAGPEVLHLKFEENKDLSTKPLYWQKQVHKFREVIDNAGLTKEKDPTVQEVYFRHIKPEFYGKYKHVGELVFDRKNEREEILASMTADNGVSNYFYSVNITALSKSRLDNHLGTESPERFFDVFGGKQIIGNREFIWKKHVYQLDSKRDEIKHLRHQDADMYMWVGDKTVKLRWKPLAEGNMVREVSKFSHERLSQKYGKEFLQELDEVDGFTIEPDNSGYEPIVEVAKGSQSYRYFNMYQPLVHQPKPGGIDTTLKYLAHIFPDEDEKVGERVVNFHHVALDWLTILFRYPKQFLPVIGLISPEQQTGKTTFMDWLKLVYGTNMATMKMEDYLGRFNSHSSFKLVIGIDEFEEQALEKATAKNKFKNQATAKNMYVEFKGIDKQEIPNYAKVVFATNSEKPLNLEEEDINRFWISRVQRLKKGQRDPELMKKMEKEIPAFLDFLSKREIVHPKTSRMWFDPEIFRTDYFMKVVQTSRLYHFEMIENYIKETFLNYKVTSFPTTPKYILEVMYSGKSKPKYNLSEMQVKEVLDAHGYHKSDARGTMHIPIGYCIDGLGKPELMYYKDKETNQYPVQRYMMLHAQDWLTPDEMEQLEEGENDFVVGIAESSRRKPLTNDNVQQELFAFLEELKIGQYPMPYLVKEVQLRYEGLRIDAALVASFARKYNLLADKDRSKYSRVFELNDDITQLKIGTWKL